MNDGALIADLMLEFDRDFGHLDFWWLSKEWKKKVYHDVAKRVLWIIRENEKFEDEKRKE